MNTISIAKPAERQTYPQLPNPLGAKRTEVNSAAGRISIYSAGVAPTARTPLLLIHSINATPSAYEVKPLFDYYADKRPVYAVELPGFGHSERSDREYTIRLMTDAILAAVEEIRRAHDGPVDALALSLSSEFLTRAALERPEVFRTLAFISPTGFETPARDNPAGGTRGKAWLYDTLNAGFWSEGLFKALTSRVSIKYFLQKTFGTRAIDEGLWNYAYLTTHQPGARHAPYYFVSGFLFSLDALLKYQALNHPVWAAHGVRGDFVDFRNKNRVEGRPNWTFEVFPSGAFPHFEMLGAVTRSYDAFLEQNDALAGDVRAAAGTVG